MHASSSKAATTGDVGGLTAWLTQTLEGLWQRVQLPEAALGGITIRHGTLLATMAGEPLPRRFDDVNLHLRLSADYRNMTVDLSGVRICCQQAHFQTAVMTGLPWMDVSGLSSALGGLPKRAWPCMQPP